MQLGFFLFQLLDLCVKLPWEYNVMQFGMLFDLIGQFFELILEVFSIKYYLLVFFSEVCKLLI